MKRRYRFAFKRDGESWGLEETREITEKDWDEFMETMNDLVAILRGLGQDCNFKVADEKKCVFDE